jgi:hypothetical protein
MSHLIVVHSPVQYTQGGLCLSTWRGLQDITRRNPHLLCSVRVDDFPKHEYRHEESQEQRYKTKY